MTKRNDLLWVAVITAVWTVVTFYLIEIGVPFWAQISFGVIVGVLAAVCKPDWARR